MITKTERAIFADVWDTTTIDFDAVHEMRKEFAEIQRQASLTADNLATIEAMREIERRPEEILYNQELEDVDN